MYNFASYILHITQGIIVQIWIHFFNVIREMDKLAGDASLNAFAFLFIGGGGGAYSERK